MSKTIENLFTKTAIVRGVATFTAVQPYSTTFPKVLKKDIFDKDQLEQVNNYLAHGLMPVYIGGKLVNQPIISATSIKNRLREGASNVVLNNIAATGKLLSHRDILSIKKGQEEDGVSSEEQVEGNERSGKGVNLTAELTYRSEHPVQSAFGTFTVSGCIEAANAVPKNPVTLAHIGGVRHQIGGNDWNLLSSQEQENFATQTELTARRSVFEAKSARLFMQLRDLGAEDKEGAAAKTNSVQIKNLQKEKKELDEQIAAIKKEQNGMENATQMPISARHIVPQGTTFDSVIGVHDLSSTVPSSILVAGLQSLSRYPKMGAFKSACGEVSVKVELNWIDNGESIPLGFISLGGFKDVDTKGLNADGQAWWKSAEADTSWTTKL